ncbi:hypothetical protein [Nocardiopsis oceani]
MTRYIGILIGTGFCLAFVLLNTGPPLHPTVALVLRSLAIVAVVTIAAMVIATERRRSGAVEQDPGSGSGRRPSGGPESGPARSSDGTEPEARDPVMRFGPFYFVVVALEIVLIVGGIQLLRHFDWPMQANVAWIAFAVGLHFFPLAWYWGMRVIFHAATFMTVLGAVGLAMTAAGHPDWVPFVSGVVTGAGGLAGLLAGTVSAFRSAAPEPVTRA